MDNIIKNNSLFFLLKTTEHSIHKSNKHARFFDKSLKNCSIFQIKIPTSLVHFVDQLQKVENKYVNLC